MKLKWLHSWKLPWEKSELILIGKWITLTSWLINWVAEWTTFPLCLWNHTWVHFLSLFQPGMKLRRGLKQYLLLETHIIFENVVDSRFWRVLMWDEVAERLKRIFPSWNRHYPRKGGRLTLLKSKTIYILSALVIPRKIYSILESI